MNVDLTYIKGLLKRGDIQQIATQLNCSVSSVSMVLAGKRGEQKLTANQQRIIAACIELAKENKKQNNLLNNGIRNLNDDTE